MGENSEKEDYLTFIFPLIIAKCPGKVQTYSYSPASGAVNVMVSVSLGPSNLVEARTSDLTESGKALEALAPAASDF